MILAVVVYLTEFVFWTYRLVRGEQSAGSEASLSATSLQSFDPSESSAADDPLLISLTHPDTTQTEPLDEAALEAGEEQIMAGRGDGYYQERNFRGRGRGRGAQHPLLQQNFNPLQQGNYAYRPGRGRGYSYQPAYNPSPTYYHQNRPDYPNSPSAQYSKPTTQNMASSPQQRHMNPSTNRYGPTYTERPTSANPSQQWKPMSAAHQSQNQPLMGNSAYEELYELETLWKQKNNRAVLTRLKNYLNSTVSPYTDCLAMLASCSDLRDMKTITLAFNIAKEFNHWISSYRNKEGIEALTEDLQHKAFDIATGQERSVMSQFLDNLVEAFLIRDVSHMAHPFCTKLMQNGKYKVCMLQNLLYY